MIDQYLCLTVNFCSKVKSNPRVRGKRYLVIMSKPDQSYLPSKLAELAKEQILSKHHPHPPTFPNPETQEKLPAKPDDRKTEKKRNSQPVPQSDPEPPMMNKEKKRSKDTNPYTLQRETPPPRKSK